MHIYVFHPFSRNVEALSNSVIFYLKISVGTKFELKTLTYTFYLDIPTIYLKMLMYFISKFRCCVLASHFHLIDLEIVTFNDNRFILIFLNFTYICPTFHFENKRVYFQIATFICVKIIIVKFPRLFLQIFNF